MRVLPEGLSRWWSTHGVASRSRPLRPLRSGEVPPAAAAAAAAGG